MAQYCSLHNIPYSNPKSTPTHKCAAVEGRASPFFQRRATCKGSYSATHGGPWGPSHDAGARTRKGRHRHNGGAAGGGGCISRRRCAFRRRQRRRHAIDGPRTTPDCFLGVTSGACWASDRKAEELQHARARDGTELLSGHLLVRRSTTGCCRRGGRVRRTKEIGRLPTLAALLNNGWRGTFRGHACFLDPAELRTVRSSVAAPPTHARIRREPEPNQPLCDVHYVPVTSPRRQPR
jgi:hypothetical protein